MLLSPVVIVFNLLGVSGIVVGIFFAIRYFIKYNAKQKKANATRHSEIDRMQIDDLG
jgi:MFS superfamily sulfate permease-like transporter